METEFKWRLNVWNMGRNFDCAGFLRNVGSPSQDSSYWYMEPLLGHLWNKDSWLIRTLDWVPKFFIYKYIFFSPWSKNILVPMLSVLERFHCISVVEGIHNGSIMSGGVCFHFCSCLSTSLTSSTWTWATMNYVSQGCHQNTLPDSKVITELWFSVFPPLNHGCRIPTSSTQETGAPATPCMEIIVPVYLLFVVCKQMDPYNCCLIVCKQYTCCL